MNVLGLLGVVRLQHGGFPSATNLLHHSDCIGIKIIIMKR